MVTPFDPDSSWFPIKSQYTLQGSESGNVTAHIMKDIISPPCETWFSILYIVEIRVSWTNYIRGADGVEIRIRMSSSRYSTVICCKYMRVSPYESAIGGQIGRIHLQNSFWVVDAAQWHGVNASKNQSTPRLGKNCGEEHNSWKPKGWYLWSFQQSMNIKFAWVYTRVPDYVEVNLSMDVDQNQGRLLCFLANIVQWHNQPPALRKNRAETALLRRHLLREFSHPESKCHTKNWRSNTHHRLLCGIANKGRRLNLYDWRCRARLSTAQPLHSRHWASREAVKLRL